MSKICVSRSEFYPFMEESRSGREIELSPAVYQEWKQATAIFHSFNDFILRKYNNASTTETSFVNAFKRVHTSQTPVRSSPEIPAPITDSVQPGTFYALVWSHWYG